MFFFGKFFFSVTAAVPVVFYSFIVATLYIAIIMIVTFKKIFFFRFKSELDLEGLTKGKPKKEIS